MQVSNSSVARPWKLEQNTSGQTSRQATFFGPANAKSKHDTGLHELIKGELR